MTAEPPDRRTPASRALQLSPGEGARPQRQDRGGREGPGGQRGRDR
ncbi:hypothetical protein HMPREF0043_00652, partial [Actinobaculum sp. oral taxon 183 str. F0552]